MARRTRHVVVAVALTVAVVASVVINLSMAARAPVPDEALRAAQSIVDAQGGGAQPKNAEGVPLDAVVDPAAMKAADREPAFGR